MRPDRVQRSLARLVPLLALCLAAGAARGDEYDDLVRYDWTKPRAPLAAIERAIREAPTPEARRAIEARLLRALAHPQATYPCKQFVCRMLRRCGSAACVPALAGLLADAKLSHMARFALQHLGAPEATEALAEAVAKTDGDLRLGLVASLGERRDSRAVPVLARLAGAKDAAAARAAIHALGRIASPEAAEALDKLAVPDALKREWDEATLRCADRLLADGKAAEAARIYRQKFAEGHPPMVRIAALRGLVRADRERAVPLLLRLLRGEDRELAAAAKRFAIQVPSPQATEALANALEAMPPDGQLLLLDALTERGDPAAARQVTALLESGNEDVRVAAIHALGVLGDAASVPPLARLAGSGGRQSDAAVRSLSRLKGQGVAQAMSKLLDSPDAALRTGVVSVLALRADKSMAPVLLKAARDKDPAVRQAAIQGLAAVAGRQELPALVSLLVEAREDSERAGLARALAAAARRVDDPAARTAPLIAGLPRAQAPVKVRLLDILSNLGGAEALDAVRDHLDAPEADVATAAVRALQDWPDPSPAPDLLRIIRTTTSPVHKVLAFRGYVRMANLASARPGADAARMYRQALQLATTPAEKKSVLAGLAHARTADALELVQPLLAEEAVRAEAELATLQIASNARDTAPTEARAAVKKLIATASDALRPRARALLAEMDKNRGFIRTWLASGPYTEGNSYEVAYPPEKKDGEEVQWTLLTKGVGPQTIDLDQAIANRDQCAAYMKTHLWSPEEQDVQLQIGSDDGVKVWVNGKQVHANDANRPCKPNQDRAKARLVKGWNTLLVKVSDNSGHWGFCVRVVRPDGAVLEGLRVSPRVKDEG